MKKQKFTKLIFILFYLLPLHLLAQEDITGLWKGSLFNDTTKQYLPYEIAISNNDGKLTGYSYTIFKGGKGDEIGIKTIRIKRKKDKIIIEDVDLISNTYTIDVPKKVRKLIELTLAMKDSFMVMKGSWKTNWIKEYHPVTGTIEIQKKNNGWKDEPLIKKLDEMNLSDDLSFVRQERITDIKPKEITSTEKKQEITITDKRIKKEKKDEPVTAVEDSSVTSIAVNSFKKEKKMEKRTVVKETAIIKKTVEVPAAVQVAARKSPIIQSVFFKTDSLVLTVYDNGIVDGDTVSILMNKNLIFSKQELSDKPISKTIYTKDIADSSVLILYAENLGSIPPNTGLLIIYDGKKRYEIFFSADLNNNAAVILRRKKDG